MQQIRKSRKGTDWDYIDNNNFNLIDVFYLHYLSFNEVYN